MRRQTKSWGGASEISNPEIRGPKKHRWSNSSAMGGPQLAHAHRDQDGPRLAAALPLLLWRRGVGRGGHFARFMGRYTRPGLAFGDSAFGFCEMAARHGFEP